MDEQAKKYIDSLSSSFYNTLLKRCMGRGHKKTKYLFNPRITEEWREGGTLVVGINHWCTQEMCEHYADCVLNSNSRKYDKSCQWAVSEVDETTGYDLRYTTYEAFNCYLSGFTGYRGARNSLKKYEEKDLLALTGLSFDGLRSKMYIEEGVVAQGFIIYLDEEHPNII